MVSGSETYILTEAASGRTVRVPLSKLSEWERGQEKIRQGEKPQAPAEFTRRLFGKADKPNGR